MDEEKELQDQMNNSDEKIQKAVEKNVKNAIRETARVVGKIVKKVSKKAVKALIKAFGWKAILVIAIIVLILILIASIWFAIKTESYNSISTTTSEVVEETGNTEQTGNVSKITTINEEERNLSIDTEELEKRLDKWFEENSVSKEYLGIGDDYSTLKKFLEAEAVTSYPDLRTRDKIGTEVPEEELQGCVQFHRYYSDGTNKVLEYMKYDEFSKKVAELGVKIDDNQTQEQIYFSENDVTKKYNELKDKFTIDKNNDLIIVGLYSSKTTVSYSDYAKEEGNVEGKENTYNFNIQVERVNFQNVIQKYSMPFELCLALLMTTSNSGFCEELAELAKDATIIIDVQDNITTTVIKDTYSYTANFEVKKFKFYKQTLEITDYAYVVDGKPVYKTHTEEREGNVNGTWKGSVEADNYKTVINTINSNKIQLCVRELDTWIANYKSIYVNDIKKDTQESTFNEEDEKEYSKAEQDYHGYGDNVVCGELPKGAKVERETVAVWEKKTNKKNITSITTTNNYYNISSSEVKETPEKFLSLLKVDPKTKIFDLNNLRNNTEIIKYEDVEGKKVSPVDNLLSAEVMLYELLSSNSKTVILEDTMRYLIGLYKGTTTLDTSRFSIYEPGEFIKVSTSSSIAKFKQYLYSFEGCTSLSADGTKYKIELDGGGNLTVGHGIDINANQATLKAAGYSINEGDYIDKNFIDTLENEIINNCIQKVENITSSLNLKQYQIYALASRLYNCGEKKQDGTLGAFGVRNGKTFVQAYKEYWNENNDLEYKASPNEEMYNHKLYVNYMSEPTTSKGKELKGLIRRRRSEWILFKTGYFDVLGEYCSEFTGSAAAILESAEKIHAYMEQNMYSYCILGKEKNTHIGNCGLDNTFEESKINHKLTCCATYVSWVLRDAGYLDVTHHSATNLGNYLLSIGFYSVDYSEIEAGDIVIMTRNGGGHTQIYAGDGQWYNAGSEAAVRKASPYTSNIDTSRLTYVLRAP